MATLSMDLRQRIVWACDAGEGTRLAIANRFKVSLGMVKKLLRQRRLIGSIAALHKNAGRKPKITAVHRRRLREAVRRHPDWTLVRLRDAIRVECSLTAVHYALKDMGLSYEKRRSGPLSNAGPTC